MKKLFISFILICFFVSNAYAVVVGYSRTFGGGASGCIVGTYMSAWDAQYPSDTDKICYTSGASNKDGSQTGGTLTTSGYVVTDRDQYLDWANSSNDLYEQNEGTAWAEVNIAVGNTADKHFIEISDNTLTNMMFVRYLNASSRLEVTRSGGGVTDTLNSSGTYTFAKGTTVTVGVSWSVGRSVTDLSVTTNKGTNWYSDGVKGIATMVTDPTSVKIGNILPSETAGQGATITKFSVQAGWETTCPW